MSEHLCRFCGLNMTAVGQLSCVSCGYSDDEMAWLLADVGVPAPTTGGLLKRRRDIDLTPVQQWYLAARELKGRAAILTDLSDATLLGLFNVEGGDAEISTRSRELCGCCVDEFVVHRVCTDCGREPSNTVRVNAGLGDGIYPVWVSESEQSVLAAFVKGDDGPPALSAVLRQLKLAAPLPMGQIDAADGLLVVTEGGSPIVQAFVQPGDYDVIAWVGPMESRAPGQQPPLLRVMALTASIADGAQEFTEIAEAALAERDLQCFQVAAAVWGSPSMPTDSHIYPIPPAALYRMNIDFCGEDEVGRQAGWILGYMLEGERLPALHDQMTSSEEWIAEFADREPARAYENARFLVVVGLEGYGLEQMRAAAAEGDPQARLVLPRWERLVARGESLSPAWGRYDAAELFRTQARDGWFSWDSDAALNAALAGVAPNTGDITWQSLMRGDFQHGLAVYEAARENCQAFMQALAPVIEVQVGRAEAQFLLHAIDNIDSNAALLRMARGDAASDAIATWERLAAGGWLEPAAYAALMRSRQDELGAWSVFRASLTPEGHAELSEIAEQALELCAPGTWAEAWFIDLSRKLA